MFLVWSQHSVSFVKHLITSGFYWGSSHRDLLLARSRWRLWSAASNKWQTWGNSQVFSLLPSTHTVLHLYPFVYVLLLQLKPKYFNYCRISCYGHCAEAVSVNHFVCVTSSISSIRSSSVYGVMNIWMFLSVTLSFKHIQMFLFVLGLYFTK